MNQKTMVTVAGFLVLASSIVFSVPNSWGQGRVLEGRMTGGGSIFTDEFDLWAPAGTRVTHGFDLQCDSLDQPNNLQFEVHLPNGDGGRFHLDELQYAWCWDDPEIAAKPPAAPFDTYIGAGIGRYNGQQGYCADWEFTDAGEPGTDDRIRRLRLWRPEEEGDCALEDDSGFVFSIYEPPGHTLTFGNHQALKDNK